MHGPLLWLPSPRAFPSADSLSTTLPPRRLAIADAFTCSACPISRLAFEGNPGGTAFHVAELTPLQIQARRLKMCLPACCVPAVLRPCWGWVSDGNLAWWNLGTRADGKSWRSSASSLYAGRMHRKACVLLRGARARGTHASLRMLPV